MALSRQAVTTPEISKALRKQVSEIATANARRHGLRIWLEELRKTSSHSLAGTCFGLVGFAFAALMFLMGVGVMVGLLDRGRQGFHVVMVLGVCIGAQLLILLVALIAWALRARLGRGLALVPYLLAAMITRLLGEKSWWRLLQTERGRARSSIAWSLIRLTQSGAVLFNIGLITGLLTCLWFLQVGFFWESTTPEWMAARLHDLCNILATPWAWLFPQWTVSPDVIANTRWGNATPQKIFDQAEGWYRFLFATIFVWGLLPRLLLWLLALTKERAALAKIDFSAKRHRDLWKEIAGTRRIDPNEKPLDGVLVLDVGGTGLQKENLRGHFLRRLRVNPGPWFTVSVWDQQGEKAAAESIRDAPAGVVLLAEGWALSPPRMNDLHQRIRNLSGPDTPIYLFVVNEKAGKPDIPTPEEIDIWRNYTDELDDPATHLFFYDKEALP